jgi:hypothetical protein
VSASESPLPTSRFLYRSGSRREPRALALRPVAADRAKLWLWRSGASSSRITWACSKCCRPAFRWLLGSRHLGSLAGPSLLTVYVGVVECAPASLPIASSSVTHARRMDGFCNQNADKLGYLARPSLLTVYVGVVECASASLPTASSSLTHAHRMDGFCTKTPTSLAPSQDRPF